VEKRHIPSAKAVARGSCVPALEAIPRQEVASSRYAAIPSRNSNTRRQHPHGLIETKRRPSLHAGLRGEPSNAVEKFTTPRARGSSVPRGRAARRWRARCGRPATSGRSVTSARRNDADPESGVCSRCLPLQRIEVYVAPLGRALSPWKSSPRGAVVTAYFNGIYVLGQLSDAAAGRAVEQPTSCSLPT